MRMEARNEHQWLQRLLGDWSWEMTADMGKGLETYRGSAHVRAIGPLWIQAETSIPNPTGAPDLAVMTLGFNGRTNRFEGNFVGSMMDFQWVYDGHREGDSLLLDCQGPDHEDPSKLIPYRDVVELVGNDEWILRGLVRKGDGWHEMMKTTYRRKR